MDETTLLLIVVALLTGVLIWSRRTYVYWQRRRVKFIQPTHILGNLKEVLYLDNSFAMQLRNFYFDERSRSEPVVGIYLFHQPALLIRNLELIQMVLIEDFRSFSNRFAKCDWQQDKIGCLNLFFSKNPEWREIRTKLSPVFSIGKLKQMFTLMEEIGKELEFYLERLTNVDDHPCMRDEADCLNDEEGVTVDIKHICDLYTTDLIASMAFGLRTHSLRNMQTEIGLHAREMFVLKLRRAFNLFLITFLPKLVPILRPKLFSREHADFLRTTIMQAIEERERTGRLRNDLIEMLVTFRKEADLNQDKSHFAHNIDYFAAQVAIFEIAGIETCSLALTFALYELAQNPDVQKRLRDEIHDTFRKCCDNLSYDSISGMNYLSMVIDETLRKYPVVPFLERECTPANKKRFYSFRPHAECLVRRGMPVFISNYAIHHDPQYWPDPERFDPERFSSKNKKSHKPMTYLPFGAGPHNCIGTSMGQLQIKLGLIYILRHYRVEFCDKTVKSINLDPKYALLANKGDIYLKVIRTL